MEELLIHPQCSTMDEEMQRELNQQYDLNMKNMIFEGVGSKSYKGKNKFMPFKAGLGGARRKTRYEAVKVRLYNFI